MERRILIVNFQPVINNNPQSGVGRLSKELNDFLLENNCCVKNLYPFIINSNVSWYDHFRFYYIYMLIYKIGHKLYKLNVLNYHVLRHLLELIYDYFLLFYLRFNNFDILITSNHWMPLSARYFKNKKSGKILFIPGNPCDIEINNIVKCEKHKYNLLYKDSYDYDVRLNKNILFLKFVDKIICINKLIHDSYIKHNYSNVVLLPYFYEADKNGVVNKKNNLCDNRNVVIGFIGHISVLKGLNYLLNAMNILAADNFNCKLIVAGTLDNASLKLIQNIKNLNQVEYIGSVNGESKDEFYKSCDIIVCPSLIDAGPVTVIESIKYLTPIVVTSNVGNNFILNKYNSDLIVNIRSEYELADGIKYVIRNYDKVLNDMRLCNEYISNFDKKIVFEKINYLIQTL